MTPEPVTIDIEAAGRGVSGGLTRPGGNAAGTPRACLVLAHGAGSGMGHPFMEAVSEGLAERGVATLRYQFPYMEDGLKRTDSPKIAQATVRAATAAAQRLCPDVPLFAGGKSFGGRMTSQAQSVEPLPMVRGLVFLGFPLHPPKRPGTERGDHLLKIRVPMLFVQGTRDELADLTLLRPLIKQLGTHAALEVVDGGDHSLHVLKRSGRTDEEVMRTVLDAVVAWMIIAAEKNA